MGTPEEKSIVETLRDLIGRTANKLTVKEIETLILMREIEQNLIPPEGIYSFLGLNRKSLVRPSDIYEGLQSKNIIKYDSAEETIQKGPQYAEAIESINTSIDKNNLPKIREYLESADQDIKQAKNEYRTELESSIGGTILKKLETPEIIFIHDLLDNVVDQKNPRATLELSEKSKSRLTELNQKKGDSKSQPPNEESLLPFEAAYRRALVYQIKCNLLLIKKKFEKENLQPQIRKGLEPFYELIESKFQKPREQKPIDIIREGTTDIIREGTTRQF